MKNLIRFIFVLFVICNLPFDGFAQKTRGGGSGGAATDTTGGSVFPDTLFVDYISSRTGGTLEIIADVTVTARSTVSLVLTGKIDADYTEATATVDGTRYYDFLVDMTVDPAASAEVNAGYYRINKTGGSNGVYILNGLEGVAGSSYADEAGTFRGGLFRTYTDPNTVAGATMRTAIGMEASARASYNGGVEAVAEGGTAFVGARIWMAPYFTAGSVGNINNFWSLWIYGEHATQRNADAAIKISDAGGGFTDDIILQSGNKITNATAETITFDAGLTIDKAYTSATTANYFRTTISATSGEHRTFRARAEATAASAATGETRAIYAQAVSNASLDAGIMTAVFANWIGKNASTTVDGRALFAEAETEATASAVTNMYAGYFRTKAHLNPGTDFYGVLINNEKMATGFQLDAYVGMRATSWSSASAAYGIDMNEVNSFGTADIRLANGDLINSGGDSYLTGGNFGIGTTNPEGTIHIHTATAGSVTPNVGYDDLVIENDTDGGISILTPDANFSEIAFGSPSDPLGVLFAWSHSTKGFWIGTANVDGYVRFNSGDSQERMRIDKDGNIGIGTTTPDEALDVNDSVTQFDSLKIHREVSEVADDGEITLVTGVAGFGQAMIGDNQEWAHFRFTAAGAVTLIANTGNVVNTDTDTNFCIYDAGTGIAIKNRLGSQLKVAIDVNYYAP